MKKSYLEKILIIIFLGFMDVCYVEALSVECNDIASIKEEIICNIVDNDYIALKAVYEYSDIFEYMSLNINAPFKTYYSSNLGFVIGNISDNIKLNGNIKFKVKDNASYGEYYFIKLKNIIGVNSSNENVNLEDISFKINILSDNNLIKSLKINSATITPSFSPNIMNYYTTVSTDTISLDVLLESDTARIDSPLEYKLDYGINEIVIKVVSQRGSIREYKLYVNRVYQTSEIKNKNIKLKSLKINKEEIKLTDNIYNYSYNVENNISNISIEAVADDGVNVVVNKPDSLVIGDNLITISLKKENYVVDYIVVVNRKEERSKIEEKSSNNKIDNIVIKDYELDFSPDKLDYELKIGDVKRLDIDITLSDDTASYKIIGNKNLTNNDIIKIVVTAENGDILTYTIKINKQVEDISLIDSNINVILFIILDFALAIIIIVKIIRRKRKEN